MQGIVGLTWSAAWHYHWPHSAACKLGVWPCRLLSLHLEQACSAEHFMFIAHPSCVQSALCVLWKAKHTSAISSSMVSCNNLCYWLTLSRWQQRTSKLPLQTGRYMILHVRFDGICYCALLPNCVSCFSPNASASTAAPWLHPLQLLLPNCIHL